MQKPHIEQIRSTISGSLEDNIALLQEVLYADLNSDVIFRNYQAGKLHVCLIYVEGMADEKKIGEFVMHSLKSAWELDEKVQAASKLDIISTFLLELPQAKRIELIKDAVQGILSGMTCLLVDGSEEALMLETRNYPHRSVEKPTNESVVNGPHEAFNEHIRTNISLIRRYVQAPELISEKMYVGTGIPTQVTILYLKGVASESSLSEVKRRLLRIKSHTVMGAGDVQQLIEDRPLAILPQILQTERPDRAASCIEDGQIALLVENSPYALIMPVTIFHLIHASDDSFLRWQYGSALRIVRLIGLMISLILPSAYIALTLYHTHLIPMPLLTSIAESRANVPFPIVIEVLFMEFSFYLLNEAGLRTPSQIGSAFGIVGALILGQTAVSANIISPMLIIIIALTGLGNYVVPNYGFGIGIVLYRLILIVLSSMLGLYGLMIGLFLIITHLCSIKSFGIDYLAPVSPHRRHNPDIILRLPAFLQKYALFFSKHNNWLNGKEETN